jgi:hypothetical protein
MGIGAHHVCQHVRAPPALFTAETPCRSRYREAFDPGHHLTDSEIN